MAQKTRDGLKINRVVQALEKLADVTIRSGSRHTYVAFRQGYPIPCPVAESSDVRRMIVPWVKHAIGYSDSNNIYKALKSGEWN